MKIFIIVSVYFVFVNCWDLSIFEISDNYYISSIAVSKPKTFLALSRTVCHNNVSNPTLLEVPWKGDLIYTPQILNKRSKLLGYQQWGECSHIQDAVSLAFEPKLLVEKLWILDKGNEFCSPKIMSYNSLYNSFQETCNLYGIPQEKLNIITIDPEPSEYGYRAFIANVGNNMILVFSLQKLKWWKIELKTNMYVPIVVDFLALSKMEQILYFTGRNTVEMFSIDLKNIRNIEDTSDIDETYLEVNVTFLGSKLGISTGLETDYKSGLSYYLVRDYVVVRWIVGSPLEAEYHNVLAQSYEKLPYVTDLFTGPQNGLWALVNPLPPEECLEIDVIRQDIPKPAHRVVKILKYNKFLDELS